MKQDPKFWRCLGVPLGVLVTLVALTWLLPGHLLAQQPGTYQPFRPPALAVDSGTKTATAVAGAATLSKMAGVITSEALVTAAGATYVLTVTLSGVQGSDTVLASVWFGTSTTGTPTIATVKPNAGNVVITVQNIAAAAALNGTLKIGYLVLKN
jgi:hypothetical protein